MVSKIGNAGRSLLGIINDILDFSKIEAGRLEIENANFQLGNVLDNVATIMGAAAGDKPVEIIVGAVPPGAGFLKGDALRLEQVLINLANNAIKFTDAGEVALTVAVIGTRPGGLDLRFAVRDTGIGIPLDKQQEIFSAFSQADASTTRRFGGTGLGLAITRRIVTLMGGSIKLASVPGEGSEFSFVLPLTMGEERRRRRSSTGVQPRMLVADDHPVAREMIAEVASGIGWRVSMAESAKDAVTKALAAADAGTPFEVALLDWNMPATSGLAAAINLKTDLGAQGPSSIIMAASHERDALMNDARAGLIDGFLSKPVTASALSRALDHARRKRAGAAQQVTGANQETRLSGISILVVDDSDINREVARQILEGEGASVGLAADGEQALEILQAAPWQDIHIVLMDVQMAGIDGYEATRRIRKIPHLIDLPVVALTAGVFKEQQDAATEASMNGFVPKPFDVDDLIATVLRLTKRQPAIPPPSINTSPPPIDLPPTDPAPIDAPAIDIERGLRNWGDSAAYDKYLRRFADTHGKDGEEIALLLAKGQPKQAAALLHRLAGAAGNMALMAVSRHSLALERTLKDGAEHASLLRDLQNALASARSFIDHHTVPPELPQAASLRDETLTSCLLDKLLRALNRDNPDEAEPILDSLSGRVPADWLGGLREKLDDFDFRGAEAMARALTERPATPNEKAFP
jgi:CheY-like chemotaxis protein